MKNILLITLLLSLTTLWGQSNNPAKTQVVRGTIIDKSSEAPLVGASIVIVGLNPVVGAVTDEKGIFQIPNAPLGRYSFAVNYIGYKASTIPEILITSGKEVILDITLEEAVNNIKEVTVSAATPKDRASNEFSTVSARSFSMDEVTRYSGGRNDVGRLVSNFAGVSTSNDSRNDIVVRGNSPGGVLWRLEGVPIPNPNHFNTLGSTGGPVSAVNTNLLKNSDFYTGAFAAEYGNANSSVFDLGFRNGNNEKHEFLFQLNVFSGLEAMAEGPLNKKKDGSYVIAYRYSFAGIGAALGIPIGTKAPPQYQDLNFKFDLPSTKKAGKFSVFGIGAYSTIDFIGKKLGSEDLFADPNGNNYVKSAFGIVGIKHTITAGKNAYVRTVLSYSFQSSGFDRNVLLDSVHETNVIKNRDYTHAIRLASFYNKKINAKLNIRTGITTEFYYIQSNLDSTNRNPYLHLREYKGALALIQPYAETQYKITDKLTLNGGIHGQVLTTNGSWSIEPRVALRYQFLPEQSISLAYGWHSQMQAFPVYFYKVRLPDGSYDNANEKLDFTRSHHIVLAYDIRFKKDWRIKIEPYIQFITGAPIDRYSSGFSMLNAGSGFTYPDRGNLQNAGVGRNFGVELTLEKFFSKGFYGLFTASVFDSKYKGSDGVWRNTVFNNRYVLNLLAGKEFKVGKDKRHAITTDLKFSTSGGKWYTPVDLAKSQAAGTEVLQEDKVNSEQNKYYLRLDFKVGFRLESKKKKISNSFYIDFQNLTFQKNIFETRYNPQTNSLNNVYQIGFFPDVMYRIQF